MLCLMYYTQPEVTTRTGARTQKQEVQLPPGSTLLTREAAGASPSLCGSLGAAFSPCPATAGREVSSSPHPHSGTSRDAEYKTRRGPGGCILLRRPGANPRPLLYLSKVPRGRLYFLKPSTGPPSVTCPDVANKGTSQPLPPMGLTQLVLLPYPGTTTPAWRKSSHSSQHSRKIPEVPHVASAATHGACPTVHEGSDPRSQSAGSGIMSQQVRRTGRILSSSEGTK